MSKPEQNVLTWVLLTQSVVDESLLGPHMSCLFVTVHLYLTAKTTGAAWVSHSNTSLWAQRENCFTFFMLKFPGLLRSLKQDGFYLFYSIKTALIKVTKDLHAAKDQNLCWVLIVHEYLPTVDTVVPSYVHLWHLWHLLCPTFPAVLSSLLHGTFCRKTF